MKSKNKKTLAASTARTWAHRRRWGTLAMASALALFSACSHTNTEADAAGDEHAQRVVQEQNGRADAGHTVTPPENTKDADAEESNRWKDASPQDAPPQIDATLSQDPATMSDEQKALQNILIGYWVVDVDETLKQLPDDVAEELAQVFQEIQTGMSFDTMHNVSLDVVHQGDAQKQQGQYIVVSAEGQSGKIEFKLADPIYAQQGIRVFANVEFPDEDHLKYQAFTEQNGQVVQSESVAVMKRVRASVYQDRFEPNGAR